MTHMELAGDVRGRDHDGIAVSSFRVDLGMEEAGVVPEAVQLVLDRCRVVGLWQFAHYDLSPLQILLQQNNNSTLVLTYRTPGACSVVPPEFAALCRALDWPGNGGEDGRSLRERLLQLHRLQSDLLPCRLQRCLHRPHSSLKPTKRGILLFFMAFSQYYLAIIAANTAFVKQDGRKITPYCICNLCLFPRHVTISI